MSDVISKNLAKGKPSLAALDGSQRTAVKLHTVYVGWGIYFPGWKWSQHVGKRTGKTSEAHVGYVVAGRMVIKGKDGKKVTVRTGDVFEVTPGHDAWVVGNEPCVALDFGLLRN